MPTKGNLTTALGRVDRTEDPHIIATVNDTAVKVVKLLGDFIWHHHEHEDEMFLVLDGRLIMGLRTGDVEMGPGDYIVIPRGVEHQPRAPQGCSILLIEPATTLNTGNVENELTKRELKSLEA